MKLGGNVRGGGAHVTSSNVYLTFTRDISRLTDNPRVDSDSLSSLASPLPTVARHQRRMVTRCMIQSQLVTRHPWVLADLSQICSALLVVWQQAVGKVLQTIDIVKLYTPSTVVRSLWNVVESWQLTRQLLRAWATQRQKQLHRHRKDLLYWWFGRSTSKVPCGQIDIADTSAWAFRAALIVSDHTFAASQDTRSIILQRHVQHDDDRGRRWRGGDLNYKISVATDRSVVVLDASSTIYLMMPVPTTISRSLKGYIQSDVNGAPTSASRASNPCVSTMGSVSPGIIVNSAHCNL